MSSPVTATASAGEQLNATVFMETAVGAGDTVEVANPWIGDPVLSCDLCHRPHPKAASEWPGALKYDYFSLQDTVRAPDGRGIYYSQIEGTGMATYTAIYWDYGLTEDDSKASAGEDAYGGYFCNVCHDRRGMNGKNTCGSSGCHRHGGSTGM